MRERDREEFRERLRREREELRQIYIERKRQGEREDFRE